jgi:hypothetical protein
MTKPLIVAATVWIALSAAAPAKQGSATTFARIGQSVGVDGPLVTPLAVLEDSRCPQRAVCVWAGQVRLRVRIGGRRARVIKELTLGRPSPVADGSLTLVSVSPERNAGPATLPRSYRFGFRFEGGL